MDIRSRVLRWAIDREACRVQRLVTIRMVVVPMGVDQLIGSVVAHLSNCLANLRRRRCKTRIDQNVALRSSLQRHIPAYVVTQQVHIVVKFGRCDRRTQRRGASPHHPVRLRRSLAFIHRGIIAAAPAAKPSCRNPLRFNPSIIASHPPLEL